VSATIHKTVKTLQRAGLTVTGVTVHPDGGFEVLTAAPQVEADDELQQARDRRRARKAVRSSQGDQAA